MVVGMVLDDEGRPICTELWPGNTTDVTTLIPIVDRLRQTFHVAEVCVVADRGMISAQTIDELEARGWTYILGVRMRSSKEAQAIAATDEGHYRTVFPRRTTAHDPAPLRVKQVWRDDRRYIVCVNADEAKNDRHDREAIVAALEKALAHGDKSLVGNKGFRRFLKTQGTRFAIDDAKITADAQYDGKWVLRTNTGLAMDVAALAYKHLFMGSEQESVQSPANRRI
jgi:transposase